VDREVQEHYIQQQEIIMPEAVVEVELQVELVDLEVEDVVQLGLDHYMQHLEIKTLVVVEEEDLLKEHLHHTHLKLIVVPVVPESSLSLILHKYSKNIQWA
jgi:hypothetical protein